MSAGFKTLQVVAAVLKKRFNNLSTEETIALAVEIVEAIEKLINAEAKKEGR